MSAPRGGLSGHAYKIVVAGVGGTGVITIGALIGMAAHLEGKGCSVLDMTGLAQKGGAVISHVYLAPTPDAITTTRVAAGGADLLIASDLVVAASDEVVRTLKRGTTRGVVNMHETITGEFTREPDLRFPWTTLHDALTGVFGDTHACFLDATHTATALLADAIAANVFLVGYAFQQGLVPVSVEALCRAIELNGVAVEMNKQAFDRWPWHWRRSRSRSAATGTSRDAMLRRRWPDATRF